MLPFFRIERRRPPNGHPEAQITRPPILFFGGFVKNHEHAQKSGCVDVLRSWIEEVFFHVKVVSAGVRCSARKVEKLYGDPWLSEGIVDQCLL